MRTLGRQLSISADIQDCNDEALATRRWRILVEADAPRVWCHETRRGCLDSVAGHSSSTIRSDGGGEDYEQCA